MHSNDSDDHFEHVLWVLIGCVRVTPSCLAAPTLMERHTNSFSSRLSRSLTSTWVDAYH